MVGTKILLQLWQIIQTNMETMHKLKFKWPRLPICSIQQPNLLSLIQIALVCSIRTTILSLSNSRWWTISNLELHWINKTLWVLHLELRVIIIKTEVCQTKIKSISVLKTIDSCLHSDRSLLKNLIVEMSVLVVDSKEGAAVKTQLTAIELTLLKLLKTPHLPEVAQNLEEWE